MVRFFAGRYAYVEDSVIEYGWLENNTGIVLRGYLKVPKLKLLEKVEFI